MALTMYLELYRDKIPDAFAALPGAGNFDPGKDDLYWAVVVPEPPDGSPAVDYIQPVGPDSEATATTHGTDTLPVEAQTFTPTEIAIWHPKTPPYRFIVTTPAGENIILNPSVGTSDDEHAWLGLTPPPGDGIGVWTVAVELVAASDLPKSFGGRNSHLNPEFLDFPPGFFERQPLLRLSGRSDEPPEKCAELLAVAATAGCAPGTVQFEATVESAEEVVELSWDFGDGTAVQAFSAAEIGSGLSVSHTYSAPGSYTAAVSVLRQAGCSPLVQVETAVAPECAGGDCAELLDLQVTGGCAPGEVRFAAEIQNPALAQEIGWDFGDGDEIYFNPQQIAQGQGLAVAHTYAAAGSYSAAVTLVRQSGCSPLAQTEAVTAPVCPPSPPSCPTLAVVELLSGCAPGTVVLRASVQPLAGVEEITWDFGDGSEAVFNAAQVAQGQGLQVNHTYANPGPFTVLVTVLRPDGCTPRVLSEAVEVPACTEQPRCPQLTGLSASGCMPRSGPPANLTLQAQGQDLNLAQQYIWEFGDGSTATSPGPATMHSYNTAGPFGIQVTMVGPENCRPRRQTVRLDDFTISPCPTPPDGGESCLCILLRVIGLAALIIGAVLIFGGACSANVPVAVVGGVLAAIGAVILIVWGVLCGRSAGCRIFQALIALLGIVTVVLALLAAIFGILALFEIGIPCLIGVVIDGVFISALTAVLTWIFYAIGCRWQVGATFPV